MIYGYIYKCTLPYGSFKLKGCPYYIGKRQKSELDENYFGSGTKIKNWIKKYGIKDIQREILEWANSFEELNKLEEKYVDNLYETDPLCLNLVAGGRHPKMSEEIRKKDSESQKGKKLSLETKLKISKARKGIKLSKETKSRMSKAKKGTHFSEEAKRKMSESKKGLKGKPYSEEQKRQASLRVIEYYKTHEHHMKGVPHSQEWNKKIGAANSIALKGREVAEDVKLKISKNGKGKHGRESFSEEGLKVLKENQKERMRGKLMWVNKEGVIKISAESPGIEFIRGRKWKN
jgi:hypothetical protein